MAWFFANDDLTTEYYTITGEDASHIARSLRMKIGEALTLCTPDGRRHECEIAEITRDDVIVRILRWPGLMMQYLTTREPDDSMLEVAIASMKAAKAGPERYAAETDPGVVVWEETEGTTTATATAAD